MSDAAGAVETTAADLPVTAERCLNCGAERVGEYCHRCGQHFRAGRLRLRSVAREFASESLTLERGLLRTLRDLTVRPGEVVRGYVAGRRRRYVNPVAYFFFAAAVGVLSLALYEDRLEAWLDGRIAAGPAHPLLDPAQTEAFVRTTVTVSSHVSLTYLAMLVPFAVVVRWLFRRSGINLAESLVLAFYTFGHALLLTSFVTPAIFLAAPASGAIPYGGIVVWLAYILFGATAFFGPRAGTVLKLLVAWGMAYLLVSMLLGGGVLAYVLLFH